jgi:hypothetical protein
LEEYLIIDVLWEQYSKILFPIMSGKGKNMIFDSLHDYMYVSVGFCAGFVIGMHYMWRMKEREKK